LFLHFGVNTFTDREWGLGNEPETLFHPTALDARQWARAARAGGFRRMILTAKHHDGFCLWPSAVTTHSVKSSDWRGGSGDVVREFVDAARAEGLEPGLYLSPWDRHEPSYGDSARYNDFYCAQLTELLTRYGPLVEIWFDGANGEGPNGKKQVYDWDRYHKLVRQHQPRALIFSDAGPDLRWVGNEDGSAGDPNWCAVDPVVVPYPGVGGEAVTQELQHGDPHGSVWRPGEADVSIRPGWFWHEAEDAKVKSPSALIDLYASSVGRNAGLLLNVPPNRAGLLSDPDVLNLKTFGDTRSAWFSHNLAGSAFVRHEPGDVVLTLAKASAFDTVVMREEIERGQMVETFTIETDDGSGWKRLADGATIGAKRIIRVNPVTAGRVRVSMQTSLGRPSLSEVALYQSPP
jgi:alpha-L-fucosidase